MKFTGFVATLAVAGAASAAAIPRDQMVSSTLQGALSQLNTVLGTVHGVANGATSNVDLSSVESQLTNIQSQLTNIAGLSGLNLKRDLASGAVGTANGVVGTATGTVNSVAAPVVGAADQVAGTVVGTAESVAAPAAGPVLSTAGSLTGGLVPRDVDVSTLLPMAQQIVSDIQGNVDPSAIVDHVNSLTHLVSINVALPLSLPALPLVGSL